jgi:hypothetical protein
MRYILSLALLFAACTRANPDAIGGAGGGGGTAGSGGAAGGGGGGGGQTGGAGDMVVAIPQDLATAPGDMTSFAGIFCGTMVCMAPDDECCATNQLLTCNSPTAPCAGLAYDCDGPEDCDKGATCCGGGTGSTCNQLNGGGCQGGRAPLCHTLDDCPKGNGGFLACCASANGGHLRFCSKSATCM